MGTSTWTSQMEVTVAADVESVVRWWTDAERRLESRAYLEGLDVLDFEYQEHIDNGLRITEIKYVTPMKLRIHVRSASRIAQGGVVEMNAEGNRILQAEMCQHRVHPNGKEDVSKGDWIWEFINDGSQSTRVRVSLEHSRDDAPWWEKYIPPIAARQHRRKELKEQAARCERDLGVD